MKIFADYLKHIDHPQHRLRTKEVLEWVEHTFPDLTPRVAWNQPMFTDHGTFIIGFSVSKLHVAVSPELAGMVQFTGEIEKAGYGQSKMLFRIKWDEPVNYPLLERIIRFNRREKAECKSFWRK